MTAEDRLFGEVIALREIKRTLRAVADYIDEHGDLPADQLAGNLARLASLTCLYALRCESVTALGEDDTRSTEELAEDEERAARFHRALDVVTEAITVAEGALMGSLMSIAEAAPEDAEDDGTDTTWH